MAIRNARSLTFRPAGVTDSVDGTNAKPGSMLRLANLVPALGSHGVLEPRPARTWFADFTPQFANGQQFDTPTQITAMLVVGNTCYGMITTRRNPGFDEPFICDMTTGFFGTVVGITAANVPAMPPATGDWTPPIIAKVGTRIIVTHPGFPGGVTIPGGGGPLVGNAHAGSPVLDGLLGFAEIGWSVSGPGIPSGATVVATSSVEVFRLISGTISDNFFVVDDATGLAVGQFILGFAATLGVTGSITGIVGNTITYGGINPTTFVAATALFQGNTITIDVPATASTNGAVFQVGGSGSVARKFGWFDISSANITKTVTVFGNGALALASDIIGLQPGMVVSGSNIPAGTVIEGIASTFIQVLADSSPAAGSTSLIVHYGLQKTDAQPYDFPIPGQDVNGPGIVPGTVVVGDALLLTQTTTSALVEVRLSIAATGGVAASGSPLYTFGGSYILTLSNASTIGVPQGTAILTFTGGTPAQPLWASGDTGIKPLPSVPLGVSERNGRAWFACGDDGIPYSDSLLPCIRTYTSQALLPGNGLPVTATAPLQQESATTGGIAQATVAFQGAGAMQVITGDQATFDLAMDGLNVATGTLAPLSITSCTLGLAFVSPEGLRVIDFATHVSSPIGAGGDGVALPFLNVSLPSRMCAAANSDTIRVAAIDSRVPGEPIEEWWYNIPRKAWSGPHTLQTSLMQRWANPQFGTDSFIAAAADVPAKLYHSDSYVSGTSDFEEDGLPLLFLWRTTLLPDNQRQSMNAVVETLLSMAFTGTQTLTVRMRDEYGVPIDEITLRANYNLPLWGGARWAASTWYATNAKFRQHRLEWTKPLVFKQAFLEVEGDSQLGFQIGDFFMRWQALGYQGPAFERDPMIAGVAPLYGLSQALVIGNGERAGAVIGPILAAPNIFFTGAPSQVGGSSVLGLGNEGLTNASFTLTLTGHASVPTVKEPFFKVTPYTDTRTGNTHATDTIDGFASSVILLGWAVGFAIRDSAGVLPPGTVIASIASDGLSLTASSVASQAVAGITFTVTGANLTVAWSPGFEPLADTYPGEIRAEAPGYLPVYVPFLLTIENGVFLLDPVTGLILTDADGLPLFTGTAPVPNPFSQAVTLTGISGFNPLSQAVSLTGVAPSLPLSQPVALTGVSGFNPLSVPVSLTGVAHSMPLSQPVTLTGLAASVSLSQPVSLFGVAGIIAPLSQSVSLTGISGLVPLSQPVTLMGVQPSLSFSQPVTLTGIAAISTGLSQNVTLIGAHQAGFSQPVHLQGIFAQSIATISPLSVSLQAAVPAGTVLTTFHAAMNPSLPAFSGTWAISGTDASLFVVDPLTGVLSVGAALLPVGGYSITVSASESGVNNSPFSQPMTVTVRTTSGPLWPILNNNGETNLFSPTVAGVPARGEMDVKVLVGTVSLDGTWYGNGLPAPSPGTVTGQWQLDDVPISGYIQGPPFTFSWDTTAVPDGTHALSMVFIDGGVTTGAPAGAYSLRSRYLMAVIQNIGPVNGPQRLPSAALGFNSRIDPTRLDYIQYTGTPNPNNTAHPYPTQFISPSNSPTKRPLNQWYVESLTMLRYGEYMGAQRFATTQQGGVIIQGYNFQSSTIIEDAYQPVVRTPLYDGGRGNNSISPYCNWVANPSGTFTGVDLSGRVFTIDLTGACVTIAGPQRIRSVLPYDMFDGTTTEAQINAKETVIGTVSGFGDFGGANDLCYDPRDPLVLYVAKTIDHCIIKIDFHFNPPHASLYAGQDGLSGYAEGNAIGQALFNEPYSIIMAGDGTMYVADCFNSAIRKITAGGVVSTLFGKQPVPSIQAVADAINADKNGNIYSPLASQPLSTAYATYPQVIKFTSNGNIVLGEAMSQCARLIDLGASTIHRIGAFGNLVVGDGGRSWLWLDVDTAGTCGPVDDIIIFKSDSEPGSAAEIWRLSLDGSYSATQGGAGDLLVEGRAELGAFGDGFHYPWAVVFSKTQGRFLINGFGYTGVACYRFLQSSDPPYDFNLGIGIDRVAYRAGQAVWETGTVPSFPWNSRPSFIVAGGGPYGGGSFIGVPSFDDLQTSYPTDAALAVYLQSGGSGAVPRPEITGNDLRDLIYFIRRSSLSGSWPTTVVPGPDDPDVINPTITGVSFTYLSTTSARVNWTTSKPTIGLVGAASQDTAVTPPPVWSPIESGYALSHSVVISGLPNVGTLHYVVLAKDAAGNVGKTADLTASFVVVTSP